MLKLRNARVLPPLTELKIYNYNVRLIQFGNEDSFCNGVLTINKEKALEVVSKVPGIVEPDLHIVKPGDMVRLCPVKEAIEPRARRDGRALFPGVTGQLSPCGSGDINALKQCSILVVGKYWGGFQDGLIDMGGQGAKYTYFSQLNNLVLVADSDDIEEQNEQQKRNTALRNAGMKLAEHVGSIVSGLEADGVDVYTFTPPGIGIDNEATLPRAVLVMQLQTQMETPGYNALVYGWDGNLMLPMFVNPLSVLDGAIISGSFMPSSSKWSTYDIQNAPIIREMLNQNGKTINFLGVIITNLNVSLEQKVRAATICGQLACDLGADCAIVAEEGYGNPDADFMLCLTELERRGIKTVGLTNECTGRDGRSQPLMSLDILADAIVSCGNVSELVELPPLPVIGNLHALSRDGLSGGWADDEILGPSVREDGSIIMENNAMFCGDQVLGWSVKTMVDF